MRDRGLMVIHALAGHAAQLHQAGQMPAEHVVASRDGIIRATIHRE
jgi:hypothetical protein